MTKKISVVNGAQAEKFEQLVSLMKHRVVQFAGMHLDKLKYALMDQATLGPQLNRLAKRMDVLILDFFVDERSK